MSIRVLLILESADDREMYTVGLRHLGYDVITVDHRADAVALVRRQSPEAVVVHLGLPGTDAFELCRTLRSDAALAHVPVIVLTSAVRPDGANRAEALEHSNCAAFVGKPCAPADLAAVVQEVHGGRRGIILTRGTRGAVGIDHS